MKQTMFIEYDVQLSILWVSRCARRCTWYSAKANCAHLGSCIFRRLFQVVSVRFARVRILSTCWRGSISSNNDVSSWRCMHHINGTSKTQMWDLQEALAIASSKQSPSEMELRIKHKRVNWHSYVNAHNSVDTTIYVHPCKVKDVFENHPTQFYICMIHLCTKA